MDNQRPLLVGDLLNAMKKYPRRFDRPLGAPHPTFDAFLNHGAADDRWVFCFAALDFVGMRRPVDILAYLHLDADQTQVVSCLPMNLDDYLAAMSVYLFGFGPLQEAENCVA